MKSYKNFISEIKKTLEETVVDDLSDLSMDIEESVAQAECEEILEGIRRVIRVRGGKIRRSKSAGRRGYTLVKGKIKKIPAAVLRKKSIKLKRAARRRKGKQASINRKAARSRKIGKRLRRRKF